MVILDFTITATYWAREQFTLLLGLTQTHALDPSQLQALTPLPLPSAPILTFSLSVNTSLTTKSLSPWKNKKTYPWLAVSHVFFPNSQTSSPIWFNPQLHGFLPLPTTSFLPRQPLTPPLVEGLLMPTPLTTSYQIHWSPFSPDIPWPLRSWSCHPFLLETLVAWFLWWH